MLGRHNMMTKRDEGLTATDVKKLTSAAGDVADPKWSQTRLLDCLVERQFEASRQYGSDSRANLNWRSAVNQLTPAGPAPRFYDTWRC
jgi:hypothetical protein